MWQDTGSTPKNQLPFTSLVRVTPGYFMLFEAVVKGFPDFFLSVPLSFVYRRAAGFCLLVCLFVCF